MAEDEPPQSLRSLFEQAEETQNTLASMHDFRSEQYQETLASAIKSYEECLRLVVELSIFSPNESVEDIATSSLPYLLINYHLAQLVQKIPTLVTADRLNTVRKAAAAYESFLGLLDRYELLRGNYAKLYERYREDGDQFSVVVGADAAAKRNAKIQNFKVEKELKEKLALLKRNPRYSEQGDEELVRQVYLTNIEFHIHMAFQDLESLNKELDMLRQAPPNPRPQQTVPSDARHRAPGQNNDSYSERLDAPLTSLLGQNGPLLSKEGKPMRPFTIVGTRQDLKKGVFRPGHNLPTMSIDEYLDEEFKRGGIIEGGGDASFQRPEPDEDNIEKADAETYKAREWDEFTEANPKGSGNTLNRG